MSFLIKLQTRSEALLKKTLWPRCFPVNFEKFLRPPSLKEHLRWLLQYYIKGIFRTLSNIYDWAFLQRSSIIDVSQFCNTSLAKRSLVFVQQLAIIQCIKNLVIFEVNMLVFTELLHLYLRHHLPEKILPLQRLIS